MSAIFQRGVLCLAFLALLAMRPAAADTLVVSTIDDLVNGDTSCPAALIANPGSDGISLREAIMAFNNASSCNDPGPHTITFAPALAGQTIAPTQPYIQITQPGVAISGLLDGSGKPTVTIDASQMPLNTLGLFAVAAANFSLTSLRVTGLGAPTPAGRFGVHVQPNPSSPNNNRISNIVISGNVFTGSPTASSGLAVSIGSEPQTGAQNLISGVSVVNNTFTNFMASDAVRIPASGLNSIVQDIVVASNTFTNAGVGVELVSGNTSGNQLLRTRIEGNSFVGCGSAVVVDIVGSAGQPVSMSNVIADTLIARNVVQGSTSSAITLLAGVTDPGLSIQAVGNTISNTRIVDNLITNGVQFGPIGIKGGNSGGTQNTVSGVAIVNNTIANNPTGTYSAIAVDDNDGNAAGNTAAGVSITNSLFSGNPSDFGGNAAAPLQIQYSLTCQSGKAGANHNICATPQFVNPAGGDFHLQAGSPAIGAGLNVGAPFGDLNCAARPAPPSIGAYEPGTANLCMPTVPVAAVLPASRSVMVGNPATAFATIINTGTQTATACGLAPSTSLPASFAFQTTNPITNALTGTANTPVNIAAGQAQSYVFALTPTGAFAPTDTAVAFNCANTIDAATMTALDTLLLSASTTPVPDIVALGATTTGDGIWHIIGPGASAAFAVATVNVGAASQITATADTGSATLPLALSLCQTNPQSGACLAGASPSVTTTIAANATPTFAIFGTVSGAIPFAPASSRVFVRFTDAGGVERGATSVAVETQ